MSESETSGRCRAEMDDCHGSNTMLVLADALDRIAADLAAVKAAVCDGSAAEERDRFLSGWGAAIRERDEAIRKRDEARAEAEHLKAVVHSDAGHMANAITALKECRAELDEARAEAERLRAELAARPPAAGWLTEEERWQLRVTLDYLRPAGFANSVKTIEAILARTGSLPVVEVPEVSKRDVPMQNEAMAYRTAMDRAGVPWKEVPR